MGPGDKATSGPGEGRGTPPAIQMEVPWSAAFLSNQVTAPAYSKYHTPSKAGGLLPNYSVGGSKHVISSACSIGDNSGIGERAGQSSRPREGIISTEQSEEWILQRRLRKAAG